MSKLKDFFSDWKYLKVCLYVAFTAAVVYILFFIIKNIGHIFVGIGTGIASLSSAIAPLIIGLIIAYVLNSLVGIIDRNFVSKFFPARGRTEKKKAKQIKRRRVASVFITFLVILVAIALLIYAFAVLIVDQLIFDSMDTMVSSIANYFTQYEDSFSQISSQLPTAGLEDKIQGLMKDIMVWLSENFSSQAVFNFLSNLAGGVLNVLLGMVVAIYLLIDPDMFIRAWRKFTHAIFPLKVSSKLREIGREINAVLASFVRGQLLDALIVALVSSAGLSVIGLNSAVLVGCFAGLANVIPYFGPIIGMVPAFIIGLATEGIGKAILAVVILFIIQQVDGNLIYPKIVGNQTELHPVVVLVAVIFGGHYWGVIGMLIAVPIAAIIKRLFVKAIQERTLRKEAAQETYPPPEPEETPVDNQWNDQWDDQWHDQ